MGASTSSMFSEIYLQHLEATRIFDILTQHQIVGYFHFVDDILIAYRHSLTDIHQVLTKFNNLNPKLTFTIEEETDNSINFLDITISNTPDRLTYKVYRKPTTTNSIIPYDSCHPIYHKIAAIKFFTNRRDTYHLNNKNRQIESDTVDQILLSNGYDPSLTHKPPKPHHHPSSKPPPNLMKNGPGSHISDGKPGTSLNYSTTPLYA
jgi:hypothetical protein